MYSEAIGAIAYDESGNRSLNSLTDCVCIVSSHEQRGIEQGQ